VGKVVGEERWRPSGDAQPGLGRVRWPRAPRHMRALAARNATHAGCFARVLSLPVRAVECAHARLVEARTLDVGLRLGAITNSTAAQAGKTPTNSTVETHSGSRG
jgi:hypothetical protein